MKKMQAGQIKEIRDKFQMTQVKFSQKVGISQGFLSDLEKGAKIPSKSLSLLLENLQSDQSEYQMSSGEFIEDQSIKIKYISLMEEHVKCLSQIIELKEKLARLRSRF